MLIYCISNFLGLLSQTHNSVAILVDICIAVISTLHGNIVVVGDIASKSATESNTLQLINMK